MNVRELLQSKKEAVITIDAEDTIGAAAHKMSANRIAALVVMKDDAPVGIISEKDIVRTLADDGPQAGRRVISSRSEEHTSELQSQSNLVCRLLLEKKKKNHDTTAHQLTHRRPTHRTP